MTCSLPTPEKIASSIDHTLLMADAGTRDIEKLCREAVENGFFGVCVHGSWVSFAHSLLSGSKVHVVSVAGFPLGASSTAAKCSEAGGALNSGAAEIDVVINIGRLIEGDVGYVARELSEIVRTAEGHTIKAIIETCMLTDEQKMLACRLAAESGAGFVKTSTGFGSGGATVADVKLLHACAGSSIAVKASGGIRDTDFALSLIEAGATRLGTSSGVAIVKGRKID